MTKQQKAKIPTREDMLKLSRWARVAFAARCARRIQPLFTFFWPGAPSEHSNAIDYAITLGEQAHARAEYDASAIHIARGKSRAAYDAADYAVGGPITAHIVYAAAAADYVLAAVADTKYPTSRSVADSSHAAIRTAAEAARIGNFHIATIRAMWRDYDLLVEATIAEGWTDDTPVPPEFFGPLWPWGEPEGWPIKESPAGNAEIALQITPPNDLSNDEVAKDLATLADFLNRLAMSQGGRGLEVTGLDVLEPIAETSGGPRS